MGCFRSLHASRVRLEWFDKKHVKPKKRIALKSYPFLFEKKKNLLCHNCLGWAYSNTCPTINAFFRINFVDRISFFNSLNRAFGFTCSARGAFISDFVSHESILSLMSPPWIFRWARLPRKRLPPLRLAKHKFVVILTYFIAM